jgi:hypothetical protein
MYEILLIVVAVLPGTGLLFISKDFRLYTVLLVPRADLTAADMSYTIAQGEFPYVAWHPRGALIACLYGVST